jgi:hypothetical protein
MRFFFFNLANAAIDLISFILIERLTLNSVHYEISILPFYIRKGHCILSKIFVYYNLMLGFRV